MKLTLLHCTGPTPSGFPKAADVSKLVDKRGGITLPSFGSIIKKRREELGLSYNDIVKQTDFTESAIRNWESNIRNPSLQHYNQLLDILKLDKTKYPELQEAEREITGKGKSHVSGEGKDNTWNSGYKLDYDYTKPATEQAKRLEGAYAGFQPKPAVELILTVMKPLSEKTFVDQALSNGKGCTWLDDCRIPYQNEQDKDIRPNEEISIHKPHVYGWREGEIHCRGEGNDKGRFPANLLVEDNVLNDGSVHKSGKFENHHIIDSEKTRQIYGKFARDMKTELKKSYGTLVPSHAISLLTLGLKKHFRF